MSLEKQIAKEAAKRGIALEAERLLMEWDYDDVEPTQGCDIPKDAPPQEFLIDHYCPRTLFLLAGEEGIGKGLCAVWMAAKILNQRPRLGNVLVMSTEDDAAEIRRRFKVAGIADKAFDTRVFHVEPRLSFKFLGEFIKKHDIVFIVADALRDYTPRPPGRQSNNDDATVRQGLVQLRSFAQEHNVAIAGIHHTNKMSRDQSGRRTVTRERIGGAGAWQQVVRHVVFLDHRGQAEDEFAMGIVKSNLHPIGFVQAYDVEPVGGLGVKFTPVGDVEESLSMYNWLLEADDVKTTDPLTAEEEYEIVLEALKETQREDGSLLGAGALWHEALKDHGQIKKATIPNVMARIRADGLITGRTVKIEWTADVEARLLEEQQELEDERKRLRGRK